MLPNFEIKIKYDFLVSVSCQPFIFIVIYVLNDVVRVSSQNMTRGIKCVLHLSNGDNNACVNTLRKSFVAIYYTTYIRRSTGRSLDFSMIRGPGELGLNESFVVVAAALCTLLGP